MEVKQTAKKLSRHCTFRLHTVAVVVIVVVVFVFVVVVIVVVVAFLLL
jgi:hypothetical protein